MHPCPACGYYMFSTLNDQSEICEICFWQTDLVDLQSMYQPMGPNHVSLEDAQKNFSAIGAIEQRFVDKVRQPNEKDVRDPKWRLLDRTKDKPHQINANSEHLEDLYYWYWN